MNREYREIPNEYVLIDSYYGVNEFGVVGNYHNYGGHPLFFVWKRGKGYGIISTGISENNEKFKEIIPCKYDAIYSNNGKRIIEIEHNFFQHEEQDDNGKHWNEGVGDDIFFVKYHDCLMECDYFCIDFLTLSHGNKYKEENFVCKEFNQDFYIEETGKYHLRKKYKDSCTYENIKLFTVFAGYDVFCAGYVRNEVYTTAIDASNANHHVILIKSFTLENDENGLRLGVIYPTIQFEIDENPGDIFGIKIEQEFANVVSLKIRRGGHFINKVIQLCRKTDSIPIHNKYDYPMVHEMLVEHVHDEVPHRLHLFFDTETTGVPQNYKAPSSDTQNWPRLVQLAWILTNDTGERIHEGNLIINPDGFTIPADVAKIHGITTQRAMEEGVSLYDAIEEFMADFNMATYVVGHNIDFDKKIVGAEMVRLGMNDIMDSKKSHCTMLSSIDFCKIPGKYGYKYPKLQELYIKLFGKEFDDAHNAMSDIEATEQCFWELKKRNVIQD